MSTKEEIPALSFILEPASESDFVMTEAGDFAPSAIGPSPLSIYPSLASR